MKKVVIILALVLTSSLTFAQETATVATETTPEPKSKFTAAVDIVYPYLWRGIALNSTNKVAFQPYAAYAVTDKLTLGVWGSTNLSSDKTPGHSDTGLNNKSSYNEFDWFVSYQACSVAKIMVSDYYYDFPEVRGRYFNYDNTSTQAIDLSVLLNFSEKGVPLDFQWNTLIAGNDFNSNGNRNFSSYAEMGYTFSFKSAGIDLRGFVGAVVKSSAYYVTDGFKFTNVGLNAAKSIKFSESFSLPVFLRYTYNENGNLNKNGELKTSFISGGVTFTIK